MTAFSRFKTCLACAAAALLLAAAICSGADLLVRAGRPRPAETRKPRQERRRQSKRPVLAVAPGATPAPRVAIVPAGYLPAQVANLPHMRWDA